MKTALFTGATGGLGSLSVRRLAERGWTVFACGTNENRLLELGAIPGVVPVHMDVSDTASVEAAYRVVVARTDRLDAIVNFAGLTSFSSMVEGDPVGETEHLLQVNVLGTVRVNFTFFDMVERARGRIVNCSSSVGWMTAQPFAGPYLLSKRALEGYNDSLRRELLYVGVRVVKLQPGSFRTGLSDMIVRGFERTLATTTRYRQLLKRMRPLMDTTLRMSGDPERIASLVVKVLEVKRPRLRYRIGSGALLSLFELLPEKGVDLVYSFLFKRRRASKGECPENC